MQRPSVPDRLLRQRLTALIDALPAAASGDVTSVHRARVASRRLRELLPVFETGETKQYKRAKKDVRRITRALGPVRELDVALGHLEQIAPRAGIPAKAQSAVARHLQQERARHRRALVETVTPTAQDRLQRRLTDTEPAPGPPEPEENGAQIALARERAGVRARALLAEAARAGGLYSSERLHAVRIAAKKLRYALEIDRALSRARAAARINQLKRLQEALGRIHDLEILIERTREVQTALAATDRRTVTDLDALVATLDAECREGHATFLRGRDALATLCRDVIDAAEAGRPTYV